MFTRAWVRIRTGRRVWRGRERVFLTRAGLVLDGDNLRLSSTERSELNVGVFPAPVSVTLGSGVLQGKANGVFRQFTLPELKETVLEASFESIQPAGPARTIPFGKIGQPVAVAPGDADFEKAVVWRIRLPAAIDLSADPILRLHYVGDVARVLLNGRLLTDDFYNGNALDVGLSRHTPEILSGDLRVAILPLRKDAPIYMAKEVRPDFGNADSMAGLKRVEIVPRYRAQFAAP